MSESFIEVNSVYKSFKISKRDQGILSTLGSMIHPKYEAKKAVEGISFHIEEGEMVGFIGPNGSGKSTTVKMLSGILYPDQGEVKVAGYIPYRERKKYVSNIGVVFGQKSQLAWDLPVIESFDLLKHIYRIPEQKYRDNLNRFVELLDMEKYLNQPVRQLSLGQRMRADIAAALLHSPKIVFFDEPTIGVDVVGKEKIRNFIVELNRTDHITMLFTTHDMQDIEKTCKRVIIIDKGRDIYQGSLDSLKENYGSTRQLQVIFENNCSVLPIPDVTILDQSEGDLYKKTFLFQKHRVNVNNLIKSLLNDYPVKDISLTEPNVEEMIRRIYQGTENMSIDA